MTKIYAIRTRHLLGAALAAFCLATPAANAASFTQSGTNATISGDIEDGDNYRLNAFLRRPEAAKIRFVYLDSPGGYLYEAYKMSEKIRAAGLSTVVDASRASCASACTALFVGGVQRYYLNAQSLSDGGHQTRGLGFHGANDWSGGPLAANQEASHEGNGILAYVYREMGAAGAITLVRKADYKGMYWISANTARSLNIATSLGKP